MRSLAAIVVGIGAYRYDRAHFPLLQYASQDADAFVRYLTTCWPKPDEIELIRIGDEEATLESLTQAFATIEQRGPFDLQLLFLSGHGFVDTKRAGFVMQPSADSTNASLLEPAHLDRLLASIRAKRTILILDCCYAEGITRRMDFFGGLGDSNARLFVASSRERQLTWEDERVGHGIFTAHLLDLLMTGSSVKLKSLRDQLDVDGELFPILCDQVPLYVFEHKQQQQEPVKGGVSMSAVTLPVARAARRIKERTAFGTAIRRLRQIVLGVAIACTVFLSFAFILAYYAQADRNGDIRLHHGTKWLAPAFRFFPAIRVDTGISFSELSDDPSNRYAIQSGEIWGFWTQMSRLGYRDWYQAIRPSLDARAALRYDVLLGTDTMRPVYRLKDESRPSEVATAAWALLDGSDTNQLNALLSRIPGADRTSPLLTPFSTADMDFNILDLTQPELGSYADALRSAAALDPDRTFVAYLGFLKANKLWLANSSTEQHGLEAQRRAAEDVADILAVIVKARGDRGEPALDQAMISKLNGLAGIGYGDLVHLALARISAIPTDKKSEGEHALGSFHGNSSEPAEAVALRQLKDSLDSSDDSKRIVDETYKRFVTVGGPEQADLTGFLIVAAEKKALPKSVIEILLSKAQEAVDRHDGRFLDTEYARILAHGMGQVPVASRPLVYRLIAQVTAGVIPMASSTAEIYLTLGRQKLDTPQMFQQIVEIARSAPPYQPENPAFVAEPLPGMSIVVGHGPWLEALAVLSADRPISQQEIEILERHANDPSIHDEIVRALARQEGFLDEECWKTVCGRQLHAYPGDGAMRQLVSDVLSQRLAALPRSEFNVALDRLQVERASETEPEVRIALGRTRINAQMARVHTTPVGNSLFE